MQPKKQLILWVLNVLNNESDANNPITQTKIANVISYMYPCDRKTVSRNIKFLQEMGYPIKKKEKNKGFYMDKKVFSVEEISYIINAIDLAEDSNGINKTELKEKTQKQLNGLKRN